MSRIMERRIQRILAMPEEDFLPLGEPQDPMPTKARIFSSGRCSTCGERVMETRLNSVDDLTLCMACAAEPSTAGGPGAPC